MLFIQQFVKLATATKEVICAIQIEDYRSRPKIPEDVFREITQDDSKVWDYKWKKNILNFWVGKREISENPETGNNCYCRDPEHAKEFSPAFYKKVVFTLRETRRTCELVNPISAYSFTTFKEKKGRAMKSRLRWVEYEKIKEYISTLKNKHESLALVLSIKVSKDKKHTCVENKIKAFF